MQTPYYSLIQLDDGLEEKLQLVIKLPGNFLDPERARTAD